MSKRSKISQSVAPTPSNKLLTPANVVTLIRICLVPVFVVALLSPWPDYFGISVEFMDIKPLIGAGIFILISATDWLDGYLARSRNEVTDFGKFMDPLADKILVAAALLALIELGSLPSWVVLVILAREFIVSGVRMVAASEGVVIAASWYGKAKTVSQMIAIVLFTVKESHMAGSLHAALDDGLWVVSWLVMIVALILTVVSMLDYIAKARHLIGLGRRTNDSADTKDSQLCIQNPDDKISANVSQTALDAADNAIENVAHQVLSTAKNLNMTVSTAESLTGGMICEALTAVPGSSDVVLGGIVSYATSIKEDVLEVPANLVSHRGVVSEEVARSMARGALCKLNSSLAVAVTGIAGPSGGEPNRPVGSVCFAVAQKDGFVISETKLFDGNRERVRQQTTLVALSLLLQVLQQETTAHATE